MCDSSTALKGDKNYFKTTKEASYNTTAENTIYPVFLPQG